MTASNVVQLPSRVTIGGSSAAAACGVDPYRSRVMLWAELTGRVQRAESEAMAWGTALEPLIVDRLIADGYDVTYPLGFELRDDARPWLLGHPDGYVTLDGTLGVLEVKTANAWANGTDRVPLAYEAQVQTYLHLTGRDHGLLAVLIGGQRLEVREVERSDAAIELMLGLMDEFMGFVQRDEPPPPDASQSSRDALAKLYPEHAPGGTVRLTREQMVTVAALRERRAQLKAIETQAAALENQVRAWMGDAEVAVDSHDRQVATWRSYTERRIDGTRLKQEQPVTAERFTNETRRRRFTLA